MTIKNEILTNLVSLLETNITDFRYVKRGLVSLGDRHIQYPSCFINSYKIVLNKSLTSFNYRRVYSMITMLDVFGKTRTGYFTELDSLENQLIVYLDGIVEPSVVIHSNVINITFDFVEEIINDQALDGMYELQMQVTIDYTA